MICFLIPLIYTNYFKDNDKRLFLNVWLILLAIEKRHFVFLN